MKEEIRLYIYVTNTMLIPQNVTEDLSLHTENKYRL